MFIQIAYPNTDQIYLSFQKVQDLSALETSLRFLPNVVIGVIISAVIELITHRFSVFYIFMTTPLTSAISPILLALIDPGWSYWDALFWAVLLSPFSDSTCT